MKKITVGLLMAAALLVQACAPSETPVSSQSSTATNSPDSSAPTPQGFSEFISRKGHQLYEGDKPFRFFGLHATELHRIEDDVQSANSQIGKSDHFKWPSAREQENWVKSLVLSGHTATRIYALSIDDISLDAATRANMPAHVLWDEQQQTLVLNETGMRVLDHLIYLADQQGLRLIIPFIDHWSWWGGKRELALMAGEGGRDDNSTGPLYDVNSKTYSLYQRLIQLVLTRTNTFTGRKYADEKAIMAWETGNELRGTTPEFLATTAAYIKSLAPHQLIMDGDQQADNTQPPGAAIDLSQELLGLSDPNVDIQSNHFYGDYIDPSIINTQAELAAAHNKVFFVGEFGLQPLDKITAATQAIVAQPAIAGALIWGYRGHREAGGFYWHKEGNSGHWSYHLPGFAENDNNQEQAVIDLVRNTQAAFANNPQARARATQWPRPEAPLLHPIKPGCGINWMGSPMAQNYRIEARRADQWVAVATVSDGANGWDPDTQNLFEDATCVAGTEYRVRALNPSGESVPSMVQIAP